MTKKFKCPACGAPMEYDGKTTLFQTCKSCNAPIVVPSDMVETSRDMKIESIVNMPPADASSPTNYATGYKIEEIEHTFPPPEESKPDSSMQILREIHAGNKIMAIKLYRETYGTDLKTAKEAVETLEREVQKTASSQPAPPQKRISDYEGNQMLAIIESEIRAGRKINAIKVFRETFNTGLKEAKDAVDAMESGVNIRVEDYL